MSERIEIRDNGWLLYDRRLFTQGEADRLYTSLQEDVDWQQKTIYGHPLPRLNAWYSDAGLTYSYSGLSYKGTGWPAWLLSVKQRTEAAAGHTFNSLLLNRYRDGQDSIGYHTDAEPELGVNPVVATVSFGAEREFVLRHKQSKEKQVYRLEHGSLLVMGGASQHFWLHGVPKTEEVVGERISLTFRRIVDRETDESAGQTTP